MVLEHRTDPLRAAFPANSEAHGLLVPVIVTGLQVMKV